MITLEEICSLIKDSFTEVKNNAQFKCSRIVCAPQGISHCGYGIVECSVIYDFNDLNHTYLSFDTLDDDFWWARFEGNLYEQLKENFNSVDCVEDWSIDDFQNFVKSLGGKLIDEE
jgi:hypothetical protein